MAGQSSLIPEVRRGSERVLAAGQNGEKQATERKDIGRRRQRYCGHHRPILDLFGCQPTLDAIWIATRPAVVRFCNQTEIRELDCDFVRRRRPTDEDVGRLKATVDDAQ